MDAAHEGDVVKVAAGTYTGVSVRPRRDYTTTGVVTQVVYLDKSITIRGGYTVTNWTTPDPGANPTTLDAQGLGRTIYIPGRASPIIQGLRVTGGDATGQGGFTDPGNGNTGDAGGGVYVFTATAILRNNQVFGNTAGRGGGVFIASAAVTFTENAVFSNTAEYKGGGVYLLGGDDALLDRNAIFSNAADKRGGGVFLAYSAATLSRNTVSTNTAYVGGGLSLVGSPATLDGNVVRANTAGWGGGLSLSRSDAVLSGNTVTANTAREGAGGLGLSRSDATLDGNTISANLGGGVYISWGSPTLRNNTITANVGLWEGSLYSAAGGGLSLYEVEGAVISRNEISHNTSVVGGGIYISLGAAVLDGNLIVANVASEAGGGVSSDGEVTLFNNVIADNRAGTLGSGLYLAGRRPCHILHTTIARNTGGDGSGIHVGGSVTLTNTILMSHTVGITVPANSTAALDGMLWGSGVWANGRDWAGAGTITTGTVNIWDEPGFVDPAVGDYHIGAGSPAADAGLASDISTDLDGDPRPAGTAPDIGADERPGPSLLLHMAASSALLSPGQTVSYTVAVTSAGVSAVTRAWLTATLPALQRATAITTTIGSCVAAVGQDEKITCDLGALPPGTRVYITMTVQVTTTLPPQLPWPMRSTVRVTAAETSNATQADTLLHACYVRLNDSPTEYPSIQAAVDASDAPGDVVRISGYCTGVTSRADARQMVYLSKTITIQGGWDASFTRRNAASFPTTLDARGQGRVLYVVGNISPTVEGLRITGGSAAGLGGDEERTYDVGGGVYILAATAVFRDNEVFGNTAGRGGGLYLAHSAARISDNKVISNTANYGGGGLYLRTSAATLDGNTIATNTAE